MSRQSAGVTLALDYGQRALHRLADAGVDNDERLSAVIEAVWWVGAGWDAAGRPDSQADAVLLGFWWVRNRSIQDVTRLVGESEAHTVGSNGADKGSSPTSEHPDTDRRPNLPISDDVWGSMDEVRSSFHAEDISKPQHRVAYASALEGNSVEDTIRRGLMRLRAIGGSAGRE